MFGDGLFEGGELLTIIIVYSKVWFLKEGMYNGKGFGICAIIIEKHFQNI